MANQDPRFKEQADEVNASHAGISRALSMLALVDRWMDEYTMAGDELTRKDDIGQTWIMVHYEELWGALEVLRLVQEALRLGFDGKELLPSVRHISPVYRHEEVAA